MASKCAVQSGSIDSVDGGVDDYSSSSTSSFDRDEFRQALHMVEESTFYSYVISSAAARTSSSSLLSVPDSLSNDLDHSRPRSIMEYSNNDEENDTFDAQNRLREARNTIRNVVNTECCIF